MSVSSDQTTRLHAPWKQQDGQVSSRLCSAIFVTYSTIGSAFFFNLGVLRKIGLRRRGQNVYAVHEAVELRCMEYLKLHL